jgi:hypothetical protein
MPIMRRNKVQFNPRGIVAANAMPLLILVTTEGAAIFPVNLPQSTEEKAQGARAAQKGVLKETEPMRKPAHEEDLISQQPTQLWTSKKRSFMSTVTCWYPIVGT